MKVELVGMVFAGKGEGTKFLELPWVSAQIRQKMGFEPYPGTLNLRLSQYSVKLRRFLVENKTLEICPAVGYCGGLLFKARMADLECGVVIPQVKNYADDILEVISPLNLRKKLGLCNGDQVTVIVKL